MTELDESEQVAKIVLEAVYQDALMQFVPHQSDGQHDFDLLVPDRPPASVEVTTPADQAILSATAAIFDQRAGGNPVAIGECRYVWILEVHPEARITNIRANVGGYLGRLEDAGVDFFFPKGDFYVDVPAVAAITEDLMVRSGGVFPAKGPGRAYLQIAGDGALIDPVHVSRAVQEEAWKADNRRKLGMAGTRERHLFVYIHDTQPEA